MHTDKVKSSIRCRNLLLFFLLAILACTSLCKKKPPEENYLEPVNVSNSLGSAWYDPSITIDSRGNIHLVWTEDSTGVGDNEQIFYATKPTRGNWSVPVNISNTASTARFPSILVDKNDNLHLTWQQWAIIDPVNQIAGWTIFYKYRKSDGNWTTPETLYWNLFSSCPILTVDNQENRYLAWTSYTGRYWLTYAMRDKEGTWTTPVILSEGKTGFGEARFFVDQTNRVHLFFSKGDIGEARFFYYTFRTSETPWSNFEEVYQTYDDWFNPSLFMDESSNLHLYWRSTEDGKPIYYQKRDSTGTWSQPVSLFSAFSFCLFRSSNHNLHLVWEKRTNMFHSQKVGEEWTEPDTIKVRDLTVETATLKGVIDANDNFHIVWIQNMGFEVPKEVYYVSFKP